MDKKDFEELTDELYEEMETAIILTRDKDGAQHIKVSGTPLDDFRLLVTCINMIFEQIPQKYDTVEELLRRLIAAAIVSGLDLGEATKEYKKAHPSAGTDERAEQN